MWWRRSDFQAHFPRAADCRPYGVGRDLSAIEKRAGTPAGPNTRSIQKELRKGEIPSCFFNLVIWPGETVEDCTLAAFARRALEQT